jgi:ergothioneine biosynthesis protein EgtB
MRQARPPPDASPGRSAPSAEDDLGRYRAVRARTEALCAPLSPEDAVVQSMPDASPAKWHLAHTTWFFETFLLAGREPGFAPFDTAYGYLFNSYYDAVGPRHARSKRGLLTRPSLEGVVAYRRKVDRRVAALLDRGLDAAGAAVFALGLAHEEQHQELVLTDVKHLFAQSPLHPAYAPPLPAPGSAPAPPARWVEHPGGVYEVGHGGEGFAFDAEGPRHRVLLEPFALASRPVTCGEWLAFMEDGGYRRPALWLSDGFATAQADGWSAPLHWIASDGGWRAFTLHGERDLDPAEPVAHVSWYEADAFARWAGARLPREEEWEVAARAALCAALSSGCAAPGAGDPAAARFHPRPVASAVDGAEALEGDVWQWTASAFAPYPRFRPAEGALGEYNGKFMANQFVLRGASCATPPGHSRPTYRNFFPPGARWQFTGVRLCREA